MFSARKFVFLHVRRCCPGSRTGAVAALFIFAAGAFTSLASADDQPTFNRDIRPILSENCFFCHGPDKAKRKAGLRLDIRDEAIDNGAIVPNEPDQSDLVLRIEQPDPKKMMPPPDSHKQLTDAQKKLLRDWIAAGAEYQPHWSLIKPVKAEIPAGASPIDSLIEQRLKRNGLSFSPEADRRTLIRRLSSDLVGLPPTPEETDAFVNDKSPDAYEKLVDRLLASQHYGERMAIGWLDDVRYADTIGYHSDNARNVWPYRDYVIKAFNDNKPFDQFTVEQLAGDLLPGSTEEQKVASCFNRLLLTTEEGGAQSKDYEYRMLTDRVRAMGTVWLGLTIGCANCHDHKFDPITQQDFYSMGAFFADIQEPILGRREDGMPLPTAEQKLELAKIDDKIAAAQKKFDETAATLGDAQSKWEQSIRDKLTQHVNWTVLTPDHASSDHDVQLIADDQIVRAEHEPTDGVATYTITLKTKLAHITALRLEALSDKSLPASGPGRAHNGNFVLTEVEAFGADNKPLKFSAATADYEQPNFGAALAIDGKLDQPHGWGVDGGEGADRHIDLAFKEAWPEKADAEATLTLKLHQLWGGNHLIGRLRISATTDAVKTKAKEPLPQADIVGLINIAPDKRDAGQKAKVADHFKTLALELKPLRKEIDDLKRQRAEVDAKVNKCLVSISGSPRTVHRLVRGNFLQELPEDVLPATPKCLPPMKLDAPPTSTATATASASTASANDKPPRRATRLDLARWVASSDNPLTARVFVNRVWRQLFGIGLCKTLDDLGSQGETPVNPELLDWLACDFQEHGWDVKRLVREIVLSRAYRQTSVASEELLARDPANRLISRQSRYRLDAELVRDGALKISGLLVDRIGGPSVKPYQPDGYWENLNFPTRNYDADHGENQYRRGLYTWWQRTFLHPSLLAFDAPSREECVAERNRSNIPQQALVLLNDPTYVEASRAFAIRIVKEGPGDDDAKLTWAWRQALQRPPRDDERAVTRDLLNKQRARYEKTPDDAAKLLHVGFSPPPADMPAPQLAAWTEVARVLLNLHETITRE